MIVTEHVVDNKVNIHKELAIGELMAAKLNRNMLLGFFKPIHSDLFIIIYTSFKEIV